MSPGRVMVMTSTGLVALPTTFFATNPNLMRLLGPAAASQPQSISLKTRLTTWLETHAPYRLERITTPASWYHWQAYLGFQALGPIGKPAIADLTDLARDPRTSLFPVVLGADYPMLISPLGGIMSSDGTVSIALLAHTETVASLAKRSITYLDFGGMEPFLTDGEIAAWSLAAIGTNGLPPLIELLSAPQPRLRSLAAESLARAGGSAEAAVPALVECLRDQAPDVRMRVADALWCIDRRPDLTIPALAEALTNTDMHVYRYVVLSLGKFGERASNAVPALLSIFKDNSYPIKEYAAVALGKISRDATRNEVIPALLWDLNGSRNGGGSRILNTLGEFKNEPDLVIPALIAALDDMDGYVASAAITLLGGFGPEAKAAVPKLISLTAFPDPAIRSHATDALRKINGASSTPSNPKAITF